jgi:hypothetical protein
VSQQSGTSFFVPVIIHEILTIKIIQSKMKQTIRTSEWLSVIAPMAQGTCIRETFTINPGAFKRKRLRNRRLS